MLRPRRNASRADAARTAAAELREARSGVRKLEVELEQPVYKKVDEDEYAEIVKKQREEAGEGEDPPGLDTALATHGFPWIEHP